MEKKELTVGIAVMWGAIIGTVVGAVTGNVGFWIAIGTGIGVLIGAVIDSLAAENNDGSQPDNLPSKK